MSNRGWAPCVNENFEKLEMLVFDPEWQIGFDLTIQLPVEVGVESIPKFSINIM